MKRLLVSTILLLASLTVTAHRANAALMTYICNDVLCTGGGDTIVTDQGVGDNFPGSAVVGQINSGALSVGGFTIVTNVSQSKPLIGSTTLPQLDLTFSAVTSDNSLHSIWLYMSDTGFTGSDEFLLTLGGTQPPPGVGNSITAAAWGTSSNNNLDLSFLLASTGTSGVTPFALSAIGVLNPTSNPYSLTLGVVITRNAAGTTTGDLNMSTVPEPSTVMLLGFCLMTLACLAKFRVITF